MLGVLDADGHDESDSVIPPNVAKVSGKYVDVPTYGDFEVCPLTKERAGWMQMVCINSALKLIRAKSD